ncbi:MAG: molybdopterin molybdotransferase MoeA [Deltaproteobacteria bacterium]|nr:molybdopterin molybdotransferase MoeA [Deltaproteobacteria bacterium]
MRQSLSVAEAQALVLGETPVLGAESVPAAQALGRVLVEAVASPRAIPPADNSAMDGYAVRAADLAGASQESPVRLPVVFEVAAGGDASRTLDPGQVARIFTGAPIPPGADSVVRQEDTERDGGQVRLQVAPPLGEHVRRAGEDVRAGEEVLEPGMLVGPAHLGMAAALSRTQLAVRRRPRVAILSGGDELVEPDGDTQGGKIVASNSYSLAAQCRGVGAEPFYLGIARDDPADIERRIRAGLGADVLISSAGVSVGEHDHIRAVLEKLGCAIRFWGVLMKPGYPMVFGRFENGPLVFGLPGNPVSAMVTFEQFGRPALLKMQGRTRLFRPTLRVRCGERLSKRPGRLHFVRVELERDGDGFVARATGNQSSGVLRSMTRAHGLLIFPAEAEELAEGEQACVQLLDDQVLTEESSRL